MPPDSSDRLRATWGNPVDDGALKQIYACMMKGTGAVGGALMADHHLGYSMPVGGVIAYEDKVSPSGVGYDIACGNKAVRIDLSAHELRPRIAEFMDAIWETISFGIGRRNKEPVDHDLFRDDPAWDIEMAHGFHDLARKQLGTVGGGNHYVDVFSDEEDRVWVGVHFGSRGLGHRIATHFVKLGGGSNDFHAPPVLFDADSHVGQEYIACMKLAGRYAYAGRNWVCDRVCRLLSATVAEEVHNHHNFAWLEKHEGRQLWVVRKGATPAFPGQRGFIGGSMGDISVIVEGLDTEDAALGYHSTVHGAGRVMSRTAAAGRVRWKKPKKRGPVQPVVLKEGKVSREMMESWVREWGVELRGAGTDESPHCYKRLPEVLAHHSGSIRVQHTLRPLGVAMAGPETHDPYRD
ncbi:MAG: RtcB family protein [Candidatus Latescibacterota bacterium]|nr:RtcB family protein [Candidatus Latescibacterota bacterium]